MLIKMLDGGLVNYTDNFTYYSGCETCDFGSEYITDIDIVLTHYTIHVRTNQMYEYALSEGDMIRLFLTEYNAIQTMTEKEFIDWFKAKLIKITNDDFMADAHDRLIEEFKVTENKTINLMEK